MKTIPSLVASSTVGIAAAGLALGKPDRTSPPLSHPPPPRPSSKKRKVGDFVDSEGQADRSSSPISRPGSSSTVLTPQRNTQRPAASSHPPVSYRTRPASSRVETINSSGGRRHSIVRYADVTSPGDQLEDSQRRDSISSRGSWIKRLSTLPSSHNNSPRSSLGPDSPSLTFSHGSAAPILLDPASSPAQLPPNKLVKRATSGRGASGPVSRSGSKGQVPTLRRPATSHQRSVTLHQQFRYDSMDGPAEQTPAKSTQANTSTPTKHSTLEQTSWRPYFESRQTKLSKERLSGRSSDGNVQNFQLTAKRVVPDGTSRPTLTVPSVINMRKTNGSDDEGDFSAFDGNYVDGLANEDDPATAPTIEVAQEPHKRARRSLSTHFSSPGSWISRTGSLRGNKRGGEARGGGKRYSSAPVSTTRVATAHGTNSNKTRAITDASVFQKEPDSPANVSSSTDPFGTSFQARSRNTSSPLPPLSRLSSFNVDLARLGLSSSSSSARSPTSPSFQPTTTATSISSAGHPNSASNIASHNSKPSRTSQVTEHTLVGSDNDIKGFTSGEEDDLDFQSDTVFDSLRSGATGSLRSRNTPLDSMFDESPPSLGNHSKNQRLSIHEMLETGGFSEPHNRIIEEDEGMSTPVKASRFSQEDGFETPVRRSIESDFPSSPPSFFLASKDHGRLSLDEEEEDEDWTRDDENLAMSNPLSPASSTAHSRRVSAGSRTILADLTHSASTNGKFGTGSERPKSNLFDWSEPASAEKLDLMGSSPRPRTAHVKQAADGRGGRAPGRRGPSALHIRSQSVPVVPDISGQREHSKLTPKFGTWGLGAKGVSEDWDNDFEFEGTGFDEGDEDVNMENSGMLVPPAIQASQASVVGHVGQIREVCLLVEDLKRLRVLAKEKDLLNGPAAPLWKEAEGIIALAVPDEEDLTLSPPRSPISSFDQQLPNDETDEPESRESDLPDAHHEPLNRQSRQPGFAYSTNTVRRRSVFSPDDDIFGHGAPMKDHLRPPISLRPSSTRSASDVARSVMETMHQHRSTSDPLLKEMTSEPSNKMPFDTTSLRDLVHRASVLSRTLADLIRKADGRSPSPEAAPQRESSPAFTRVFTDPMASPPKNLPRSQSNNSVINGSIDSSPTRSLTSRMHMMTVV